ncbi:MAG TPA: substrate-binding domain-containing protein [Polyangiaceae bacterium]|jgi:quinoprotein dehydrogenase-associated probable ABC transporter substrate-binding protein|nr:substrate-binding domain-containing protein [Polyangiaceae bacterium]
MKKLRKAPASAGVLALLALLGIGVAAPADVPAHSAPPTRADGPTARKQLRVCADGNNMPFSNERGEGFENRLASLVAHDLGEDLVTTWWPQRRGFFRNTLKAHRCDVVVGVPTSLDMVETTRPYYRSGYVFVYASGAPHVKSLDDPALHALRIGVPMVGDDGANPPPVLALASRGLVDNMRGYSVYGDYRDDSPPADLIRALGKGEVDVAIAWGPLAGYYAMHATPRLALAPIPPEEAPPGLAFQFDVGMGVRHGDHALRDALDGVLARRTKEVDAILRAYGVPRVPAASRGGATAAESIAR